MAVHYRGGVSDQPVTTCPNCGAAVTPDAAFCATCGTALKQAAPPLTPGPRPALSADDRRLWSIGAHASAAVGAVMGGVGSFVGPLVVWLIQREGDPFVADHALEALNFNIAVDLVVVVGLFLGLITFGLGFIIVGPVLLVVGILWLVFTIQGAMAASRGETYRYPMSLRLLR